MYYICFGTNQGGKKTQHFSLWKSLWFSYLLQKDKYYFFHAQILTELKRNIIVIWQVVYKAIKYVHILVATGEYL